MSQHVVECKLTDGRTAQVLIGWDPPLDAFFLTVTVGGELLYSTMNEEEAFGKDLNFLRTKLRVLGVTVSNEVFDEVELDRRVGDGVRRELHRREE